MSNLSAWQKFNKTVAKLAEHQLEKMLASELVTTKRRSYALRLHARLATLRSTRERREIVKVVGKRVPRGG